MAKINTPEELRLMREKLRADLEIRENSNTPDELPQIRVSMDECGIAAGAKAVLATFVEELAARRIRGIVTQTGCAGHCKDEPTVEITLPGRRPVLYGHVTAERVAELVERRNGRRPDRSINCVRQSENFRKEATGPTVEPGI